MTEASGRAEGEPDAHPRQPMKNMRNQNGKKGYEVKTLFGLEL